MNTMVATPTTVYQGGDQNPGENNTNTMAMTYFPGYSSNYAENTGAQEPVYQPLMIQATPTMSRDFYLDRYFNQVIGVQYRLANLQTLPRQMSELSERSPAVKTSISLLSVLYLEAQQLAQSGVAGTLLGSRAIDATGRGAILGDSDPYSNPQFPLLELGVPGYGFINSSSLLPSNSTNFRAQYDLLYARVKKLLAESKIAKGERYDQGDAMACLHVISAFLFSGGRGDWDQFLQIAAQWVWGCVSDYGGNVAEALRDMDSMGRFIFRYVDGCGSTVFVGVFIITHRTTMWMDVFGSISLCKSPRFIQIYRTLFRPGALDTMIESSVETNMDRVMGCPNEVILAFAEIADLEARKDQLVRRLNEGLPATHPTPGLAGFPGAWRAEDASADSRARWQQEMASLEAEGLHIERLIPEALGPAALPMDRFVEIHSAPPPNSFSGTANPQAQNLEFSGVDLNLFGGNALQGPWPSNMQAGTSGVSVNPVSDTDLGGYIDPDEDKRGKIAEVFRNAARVYLHSVISGCDPLVPAIRRAVQATIRALEVSNSPSLPFQIFSCSINV
jgi:Fungal specific transcription factor domain